MSRSEQTTHDYEALLDRFQVLPGRVERPRTFMEITRYPHYENVCSNILAFFIDPEELHGLGTLVLDALTGEANIATADQGVGGSVSVEREAVTPDGNRIDILVTSYDRAILIENKIYASVTNPFDDYAAYLDEIAGGRRKDKILLTLYPMSAGQEWGFRNLTHEDLIGRIRSLLGHYVSGADARHLTMFLDFLNTLDNLGKGTRMNKEFVDFLAERGDDIESLSTDLQQFRNELNEKVKRLQSLVDASHPNIIGEGAGPRSTLSSHLHHIINVPAEGLSVDINTIISPHGWEIEFDTKRKSDYSRLRRLLHRLEISFEEKPGGKGLHFPAPHSAYDEDLESIRSVLQDLLNKIATTHD